MLPGENLPKPNVLVPITNAQFECLMCALTDLQLAEYKSEIYNIECGIDYYNQYEEIVATLFFVMNFEGVMPDCINSDHANQKVQAILKKYCLHSIKPCRTC
jgi:hypothetical protein